MALLPSLEVALSKYSSEIKHVFLTLIADDSDVDVVEQNRQNRPNIDDSNTNATSSVNEEKGIVNHIYSSLRHFFRSFGATYSARGTLLHKKHKQQPLEPKYPQPFSNTKSLKQTIFPWFKKGPETLSVSRKNAPSSSAV